MNRPLHIRAADPMRCHTRGKPAIKRDPRAHLMGGSSLILSAAIIIGITACGENYEPTPLASDAFVDMSGVVVPHPLTALAGPAAAADFNQFSFSVELPSAVLAAGLDVPPLAEMPLSSTCTTTPSAYCAFGFNSVDVTTRSSGLACLVQDTRAANQRFEATFGGLASTRSIEEALAGSADMPLASLRAFAIPRAVTGIMAALLSANKGAVVSSADLLESGYVLGMALDELGRPVEGATVGVAPLDESIPALFDIYYLHIVEGVPFFDQTTTSASGFGAFLAVPTRARPMTAAVWFLIPAAEDTRQFSPGVAVATTGAAFALFLLP
ncbi:MAG: hypothetical protein H6729_12770 [Deltaproteobacteria bacterium]|nr:hypothetical protein [Deltaproteobacteria bacterium]